MADNTIDTLQIQISSNANKAIQAISSLQQKLGGLNSALGGLNAGGLSGLVSGVSQLSHAMSDFKSGDIKTSDFSRIANGLNKLSTVDVQGVSDASRAISTLTANLSQVGTINFDSKRIDGIASSISKLGRASVTEATQNLEFLKSSVSEFVSGMNSVGSLDFATENLHKLISSISKLGGKNATQSVKNLPHISAYLKEFVTGMNSIGSVSFNLDGLEKLVANIGILGGVKATQSVQNLKPIKEQLLRFISGLNGIGELKFDLTGLNTLVSAISRLGGKSSTNAVPNIKSLGVALKELMATLSKAPKVSQNLISMTNALANLASSGSKVNAASRGMQRSLNGYSMSAKNAKSHTNGLAVAFGKFYATYWLLLRGFRQLGKAIDISSALTEVQNVVDVTFGKYTDLVESFSNTSIQDFGISELTAKQVSSRFQAMGTAMGFSQGKMADMSIELTKLAADMASFYNVEQKAVSEDLESIFTGQTRPLRTYGLDLTQATLQEWALKQGIDANVQSMSQAEKTLLRYQYVMSNTGAAQGDFARTSGTWANQLRILNENFKALGTVVGGVLINAFKPFISALNQVMGAVIQFAKVISDALGAIFGWEFQTGGGGGLAGAAGDMEDLSSGAGGAADNLGSAADNAKKLKGNLQGIDELNVISAMDGSSGGGGGNGIGGGGGGAASPEDIGKWVPAESLWEKYTSSIDSLFKLGEYIGNTLTDAMNSIDLDKVYEGARNFGAGLASFLNGLISPELFGATGRTIAGALNTAIYAALSFGETFDWSDFGLSIATGINEFFKTFDFADLASTINVWSIGLLDALIEGLNKTDWNLIGDKIGLFLAELDFLKIGTKLAQALWGAINKAVKTYSSMFKSAPIETSILTAVGLIKFTGIGKILSLKLLKEISKGLSFAGIGKVMANAFKGSTIISTITTTMAETGATLPAVLFGLIAVPIKTFFTTTLPGAITGTIASLGASLATVATSIGGTFGLTGVAAIVAGGAVIVAAAVAAVAAIVAAITHWDEIKEFFSVTLPAWWSGTAVPFFESIPGKLSEVWENVKIFASEKWDSFLEYMSGIPDKISLVIGSIAKWFNDLPGKIGHALGYALGTVTKWGTDLFTYLSKKIPETVESVRKWFSELPNKIYAAISSTISKVTTWGTEVFNVFKTKVSEIINTVVTWFGELPGKVYGTIIKIKDNIATWATNTIGFFKTEIPTIIDKVIEFFRELPRKAITVGEDLIKGLWEGIKNLTDWLGTKIGDFCKGVISGFKEGFDEHSPSKKAFEIGDYFTIGLRNGITDKFSNVMSDIKKFSAKINSTRFDIPSFSTGYEINRSIMDKVDIDYSTPSINTKEINAQLTASISELIDYDRLGQAVYDAQSRAMQENPVKIGDGDVFNAWRREDIKHYSMTRKPSPAGI